MKNHDKNSQTDPLEANLSKLICKDNLPPTPDEEMKTAMLESLRVKQVSLTAPKVEESKSLRFSPLFLGGVAAAVVALLGALFYEFPSSPEVSTADPKQVDPKIVELAPQDSIPVKVIPKAIAYEAMDQTRRIELRDGSTAIAEKGTRFIEVAPRQLKLEVGSLYMLVAKAATPLEVVTPQGKALALGTRFLVSSKDADTRVAVAQGSVQLVRANDAEELVLARGEEGLLAPTELTRRPAPRLSHLVSWARSSLRQAEDLGIDELPQRGLLAVDPQGQESRLSLREYSLDVFIENGVARTTIDQTFFNHYHSNTEGTFYFPLPPGAAVSRLAMYVNGVRNEGGMVERKRGQQIYNDIKYANRDPALLEQLEGNLYKLRIFPLEGRQEKRIFLSFTQDVDELYRTLRYWFPMDHTQDSAGVVKIKVRIKHGGELFDAESSTHEFVKTIDDGDLVLSYEAANIKPDQDLLLKLIPKFAEPKIAQTSVLKRGERNYLHTRIRPELKGQIDPQPRQWFVLNDTSASRSAADLKAQAHLVERLLAEADDEDLIAIANLNIDVEPLMEEPVSLRDEKAMRAVKRIRAARRVGGTNFAAGIIAMREWIARSGATNPHLVYLGDGLATDGAVTSRELTALLDHNVPFLGIAVGKKADLSFLRDAANATGGGAYLMNPDEDLNWRVFDMLASMNTPRLTGLSWDFPEGIQAYGDRGTLSAGEALTLVAAMNQKLPSQVILRGKLEGKPWQKTISLEPTREDVAFIPRFWAQRYLEELLKDGETHREEVIRLSKKHYVATPFTSLIVLENDKMYKDYEVEKGRTDHWAAYPAPDKIPVVREPIPWRSRSWNHVPNTPIDDSKIVIDPRTAEEILETLLPPAHRESGNATSINQVSRYLYKGESYYDLGLYDRAEEEFKNVLRLDPYSKAARRWMERCAAIKSDYYRAAYDQTRAEMLMSVDRAWELAVRPSAGVGQVDDMWANSWSTIQAGKVQIGGAGGGIYPTIINYDFDQEIRLPMIPKPGTNILRSPLRGMRREYMPTNRDIGGSFWTGSPRNLVGRQDLRSNTLFSYQSVLDLGGQQYAGYRLRYIPFVGDLTTSIPALATTATDRTSAVEMKLGREKRGSITDEVAALVRAAEAKRKPVRLGETIITPDGRVKGSSSLPMYLEEETISDGKSWFHIYRELGFATKRPVTPTNRAVIQSSVPHWPPSLNELEARWTVTLVAQNEGSFEIVLIDPDDASKKMIMKIATNGHLLHVSQWKGEEQVSSRTFKYEGQDVIITDDLGIVQRYEAVQVEVAEALFAPDLENIVELDLPFRKPAFYEKQLVGLKKGETDKKKQLLRHFIFAKLLDYRLADVYSWNKKEDSTKSNVLTLKKAWTQLIQLGAGSTPVFDHRTLAAAVDINSAITEGSDFLTHFKRIITISATHSISRKVTESFIQEWPESPNLLAVVSRCHDSRVWAALLDFPDYRSIAIERIATREETRAWPNPAALKARIVDFLVADAMAGNPPIVSREVAHFLGRQQQDNTNWKRLVESYREIAGDLTALDSQSVAAIFDLAIKEKDQELEKRCFALLSKTMVKPQEIVILADIYGYHGRNEQAVELYQKALAGIEDPDLALLQKASLSARQVDEKLSISWQLRALRKLSGSDHATNKNLLSRHYASLLSRALAAGELTAAMDLAVEGYQLLPDQHDLVMAIASHLHQQGQETERWRWLSTIIDRNPKNAEASGAIGAWYANQKMLNKADEMYADAHSFDSAHPQWLVNRVRTLYYAGKFEKADEVYRDLVKTDWAYQLKRLVPSSFQLPLNHSSLTGSLTMEDPGEGWTELDFDAGDWKKRPMRFTSTDSNSPLWESAVYTRQKFQLPRIPRQFDLQVEIHGVECEIYLNGTLLKRLKEKGKSATGRDVPHTIGLFQEMKESLKVGENVLAVRYKKLGKSPRANVSLLQVFPKPRD